MNEELCLEKHKRIDEKFDNYDKKLDEHDKRLDQVEQKQSKFNSEIEHLCENLKNLTSTIKWFMGILVTSFVGFFFYAVQQSILK